MLSSFFLSLLDQSYQARKYALTFCRQDVLRPAIALEPLPKREVGVLSKNKTFHTAMKDCSYFREKIIRPLLPSAAVSLRFPCYPLGLGASNASMTFRLFTPQAGDYQAVAFFPLATTL